MKRDIFQAIADPTRRAIILLLAGQPMTPNALAEQFDSTRQAVSKHIRILKECGVVKQRKAGREIYCHLNRAKMKEIDTWLARFRKLCEDPYAAVENVVIVLRSTGHEQ